MGKKKKIFIVDDEESMVSFLSVMFENDGFEVHSTTDGGKAVAIAKEVLPEVVICDVKMDPINGLDVLEQIKKINKDINVIMITAYASIEIAVDAMKKGAFDYIIKPFKIEEIRIIVNKALERRDLIQENTNLKKELKEYKDTYVIKNIIGVSKQINEVYETIKRLSASKANVLITGESGTGKELIAKALHCNSLCRDNNFVAVNCSSLPANLLESELFGHVKGSFTGALKDKKGLFEEANKGTFFLDEIGDMPIELQAKLLRAIQEQEIRRIGSNEDIKIDVRIVTATNRDLEQEINAGNFREDLFYRISVININVAPLRERKEDIPLLITHFLDQYSSKGTKVKIDNDVVECLCNYHWPGNVRELENIIERAMAFKEGNQISLTEMPESLCEGKEKKVKDYKGGLKDKVDSYERDLIVDTLAIMKGNQCQTAKKLGITRQNLQYKVKKYKLK